MMMFVFLIIFLIIGFVSGLFSRSLLEVNLVKDVRVGELGSLLTSLTVAVSIPFLVNRWLEKQKTLKSFIVEDFRDFERLTLKIKEKLESKVSANALSEDEVRCLQQYFNDCDLKLSGLIAFVEKQKASARIRTALSDIQAKYFKWWQNVTGDVGFGGNSYKVTPQHYREQCIPLSKLHLGMREALSAINKGL